MCNPFRTHQYGSMLRFDFATNQYFVHKSDLWGKYRLVPPTIDGGNLSLTLKYNSN